jgi:DNA segregation ATPase FtsK/SpoIIIE-like protein
MTNLSLDQTPQAEFTMPLTAKLVRTAVTSFCMSPVNGDDSWELCSIGVAENSVVATDSRSAILIGEPAEVHEATQRKECLIECERAKQYGDPVRALLVAKNLGEDGSAKQMPDVQRIITQNLSKMKSVAVVDPSALLAIAKVAEAAGALSVEIFQPKDGELKALGFRFSFPPDNAHTNLFSTWEGDINASGVFLARQSAKSEEPESELAPDETPIAKAPPRRSQKNVDPVPLTVVSNSDPVVDTTPQAAPFDFSIARMADGFGLPSLGILAPPQPEVDGGAEYKDQIVKVLLGFNIIARPIGFLRGPAITQYQIEIPPNIKTTRVSDCADNLAMSLAVTGVRIEAPIPGKNAVGIEVPNKVRSTVALQDLLATSEFFEGPPLTVALGKDVSGRPVYGDLAKMPHLLIAGATGSGKSIGLATLISSLLFRLSPKQLRFVMIDPKRVELALFDGIPHLMCPVIKDVKEAPGVLRAIWREMDRRYELLQSKGVRNIDGWNAKVEEAEKFPYIVVVIDELADLMMAAKAEVETTIVRIAQMARAVGIHLVIATQRPSVDVVTGLIKANVPSRIAFAVASGVDSRVILDTVGAEKLLGAGDALYWPIDAGGKPKRIQGGYVSETEVDALCSFWRNQAPAKYELQVDVEGKDDDPDERDDLLRACAIFAVARGQCSTSMIQRKFSIGFQRASRLQDALEAAGIIGPRDGPKPRTVLMGEVEALEAIGEKSCENPL